MREIKFRAWYTPFGGKVKPFNKMEYGRAGSLLSHAELSPDQYELMQYTGLKDKNGTDIYEGDIVERKVHVMMYGTDLNKWVDERALVEWKYSGWYVNEDVLEFVLDEGVDKHTLCRQTALEVIGNIYENPKLLEVAE